MAISLSLDLDEDIHVLLFQEINRSLSDIFQVRTAGRNDVDYAQYFGLLFVTMMAVVVAVAMTMIMTMRVFMIVAMVVVVMMMMMMMMMAIMVTVTMVVAVGIPAHRII